MLKDFQVFKSYIEEIKVNPLKITGQWDPKAMKCANIIRYLLNLFLIALFSKMKSILMNCIQIKDLKNLSNKIESFSKVKAKKVNNKLRKEDTLEIGYLQSEKIINEHPNLKNVKNTEHCNLLKYYYFLIQWYR